MIAIIRSIIEVLWGPEPIITIQHFFGSGWLRLFQVITYVGDTQGIIVLIALALWISGRRLAYSLIGIVLLAVVTNLLLWKIIGLPRPHDPRIVVWDSSLMSSFPSGHTVIATTLWGLLSALGWIPKVVAVVIILAGMLSRLYLGMHYLGDVFGGGLIGLVLVAIHQRLWPAIAGWFSRQSFKVFQVLGGLTLSGVIVALPFAGTSLRLWQVLGMVAGATIGSLLEYWYVRFSPTKVSLGKQALKVLLGLTGLIALLLIPNLFGSNEWVLNGVAFALAALWLMLLAPALFVRMGLSQTATR
ncbi:MAG: phosphatase PAP2 family protein [Cyanobacteriota bacterium]